MGTHTEQNNADEYGTKVQVPILMLVVHFGTSTRNELHCVIVTGKSTKSNDTHICEADTEAVACTYTSTHKSIRLHLQQTCCWYGQVL